MASNHKEISHTRINRKKFEENRSKIDWSKKGDTEEILTLNNGSKIVVPKGKDFEKLRGNDANTKSL